MFSKYANHYKVSSQHHFGGEGRGGIRPLNEHENIHFDKNKISIGAP